MFTSLIIFSSKEEFSFIVPPFLVVLQYRSSRFAAANPPRVSWAARLPPTNPLLLTVILPYSLFYYTGR